MMAGINIPVVSTYGKYIRHRNFHVWLILAWLERTRRTSLASSSMSWDLQERVSSYSVLTLTLMKTEMLFLSAGRDVPLAATRIYSMSFFTGISVSAVVYWALNLLFPTPDASRTFKEVDESADLRDSLYVDQPDVGSDEKLEKETDIGVREVSIRST